MQELILGGGVGIQLGEFAYEGDIEIICSGISSDASRHRSTRYRCRKRTSFVLVNNGSGVFGDRGQSDLRLTREGRWHMVLRKDEVEIGDSRLDLLCFLGGWDDGPRSVHTRAPLESLKTSATLSLSQPRSSSLAPRWRCHGISGEIT
jgi:hypothetical protein